MDTVWSLPVAANWLWGHLYMSILPIFSTERQGWRGWGERALQINNRRAESKVTAESWIQTWIQGYSSQHHKQSPWHQLQMLIRHACGELHSYTNLQFALFGSDRFVTLPPDHNRQLTSCGKAAHNWAWKKHGHHSVLLACKLAMGKAAQVQPPPLQFILVSSNLPNFKDIIENQVEWEKTTSTFRPQNNIILWLQVS